MSKAKDFFNLLGKNFFRGNILTHSAALSFYSMFSLIPLTIFILSIFHYLPIETKDFLTSQLSLIKNPEIEDALTKLTGHLNSIEINTISGFFNLLIILFTATGLINFTQKSIDSITNQNRSNSHIKEWFLRRFISSALIILFIFFSLMAMFLSSFIGYFFDFSNILITGLNFVQPILFLVGGLFMAIQYLPAKRVKFKYALSTAVFCALAFTLLNFVFSYSLKQLSFIKVFVEAKTLIIIMMWIYLHALIFFTSIILAKTLHRKKAF